MNLKQLKYFQGVATHRCITTAAAHANVAQSALSSQIAALEADLGVQLLVRHSRGVSLTRSGEVLLERSLQVSSLLDQARRDVLDAAEVAGEITIGIPVSMAAVLMLPLLRDLEEHLPRAEVHVFEGLTGDLRAWLRSGKIEIGILYGDDHADGLRLSPLAEDELVCFGEPAAATGDPATIPFASLAQFPIYTTDGDHPVRPLLDRLAKEQGILLRFGAQINSISQLKVLAREGRGQTILPRVALASEPADAGPQIRSINPAVRLRSFVATPANAGNRIQAVQQILRNVVERLVRAGAWPGAVLLAG
jgi:LysR family transcriptional regulator, nitrogen assimilation regulatory protein